MVLSKRSWLVPVALGLAACSGGESVDIGDDKVVRTGEKLSDYAATWVGYAEAFEFDSGSDAIRIVLDADGEGTFEVGSAAPLPAPTDPDVGPPGIELGQTSALPAGGFYSGFAYSVRNATVENRRLRLELVPFEVFSAWCELQTPILDQGNSEEELYYCVNNWGGPGGPDGCSERNPDTGELAPISCEKRLLCLTGRVCKCDADHCWSNEQGHTITLDAALEAAGDELEGTLTVGSGVIVRMTRQ